MSDKPPSGAGRSGGWLASAARVAGKCGGLGLGFDE
jgi:hypothetical protein